MPHGPVHGLGRRPVGLLADRARARGRGHRREGRRGRRPRSRRATTSSPASPPAAGSASTARTTAPTCCLAIRDEQNKGHLPDGTTRLSRDGEDMRHFMGCSTFAEYTVMSRVLARQGEPRGAARAHLPVRLRPLHRARRRDVHGGRAAGIDLRRLRRGHGRPRRGRRLPPPGSRANRLRRPLRRPPRAGQGPGRDRRDEGRRRASSSRCWR